MKENLAIISALGNWNKEITRMNTLLEHISNEDLQKEIATGKNTGIYLLGHLTAAAESLRTLLGLGEKMHPGLEQPFIRTPDKSGQEMPSADVLRGMWKEVTESLHTALHGMTPEDWYGAHTNISPEDFEKEPHRNKLSVLFTRTIHQAYHAGQLALLAKK